MAGEGSGGGGVHHVTIALPRETYEIARGEAARFDRAVGKQIKMDMVRHYGALARRKGRK